MSKENSRPWDVLVGGSGIAAAAACMRLCALGYRPLVLAGPYRGIPGIEAIPAAVLPLFAELGMLPVLEEAQAAEMEGFENHWRSEEPALLRGRWIHVERTRLAMAAMREAVRLGATVQACHSLPKLIQDTDGIRVVHQGISLRFKAAIDATGRSAVWSRPVRRCGRQVADLYTCGAGESPRGRLVRLQESWAYRIGLGASTTVAFISPDGRYRAKPHSHFRHLLGLSSARYECSGRRPAFPQWSENPILGRRLAVGDAALAYDPVAGQGIRFALSSAVAAVAVINTLRVSPGDDGAAQRFYRNFIAQARQRHLEFVDQLWKPVRSRPRPVSLPAVVVFRGQTASTELQIGSRIVVDQAIRLADGAHVRWVGGVDLLRVRDLACEPLPRFELAQRLSSNGLSSPQVEALLQWCVQKGIITSNLAEEHRGLEAGAARE